jgi:predicted dehydrogenase
MTREQEPLTPLARGIGVVGAGLIVEHAHLPAYRRHGLQVRLVYDVDQERSTALANAYPGARAARSLDELLDDPAVEVVDIAVSPSAQVEIARAAAARGKHVLCQKPLAPSLAEAIELVDDCARFPGVRAVNQQMRWEPITAESKARLVSGDLGQPTAATIRTNLKSDFPGDHWLAHEPRLMALYGAIHFLDTARFLFGEPARVTARLLRDPLQVPRGEMWINAWLEWENGPTLVLFERYTNWSGDQEAVMRVEGTQGTVRGRFGIWDTYPQPCAGTVEFKRHDESVWEKVRVGATWLPDAFAGPMLELLDCIDTGRAHQTSWEDNLRTLRLVEALYESSERHEAVDLAGETAAATEAEADA